MFSNLVITHKIKFPIDPAIGIIVRTEYSTRLKNGHLVVGWGYEGLISALLALKAEVEEEAMQIHEEEQRKRVRAKIEELRVIAEYAEKREIEAAAAAETQRQIIELYYRQRRTLTGELAVQTRYFGFGAGPATLFHNGEEISYGRTSQDLLAEVAPRPGKGSAFEPD